MKKPKILIIDDIKDNIEILRVLVKKNFPDAIILTAISGILGIELCKSTNPDLILLDILMPDKDGFTVCEEIKNEDGFKDTPIVFVTALKDTSTIKIKALDAGAEGFLQKPIQEAELVAQTRAMLKLREALLYRRNEKSRLEEIVNERTDELSISEQKHRQLVELMPLGLVHYKIVNTKDGGIDFEIQGFNDEYKKLVGKKSLELLGKNLWDLFPEKEQYWIDEYERVAVTGVTKTFEYYSAATDRYLRISAYKIESDKMSAIIEDVSEDRRKQDEILFLSYHDSLTDLHNRRYYEDNLVKLDKPENYPLTIIMSDINGLKLLNDAFGHSAGDKLLISAANIISDTSRKKDLVARVGGDEFVIVMPNTTGLEASGIIDTINIKAKEVTVESIELSISFGFATKNETYEDIQETYRSAEDLMYRAKLIEIPSMRSGAIETILNTLHEKDKNSEIHSRNVSNISERIATACGLDRQEVNEVKTAGLLHDIGKIIIPISIITKEGKLTVEEYNQIKGHPEIGFRILNSTHDMRNISNIVLSHHEKWDGLGYPRGIEAEEIPLQSRIISIADAFDAMTSERSYRDVFTNEQALEEVINNAGTQFDPGLVEVFKENFSDIIGFIK